MGNAYQCDRCGDFGKAPGRTLMDTGLDSSRDNIDDHRYDLCSTCSVMFKLFLRGVPLDRDGETVDE